MDFVFYEMEFKKLFETLVDLFTCIQDLPTMLYCLPYYCNCFDV